MARIIKSELPTQHVLTIRDDNGNGELILVRGGKRAYLWAGPDGSGYIVIVSGAQTLRKLAKAILKEIKP